jgi:hypothetical protein
VPACSPPDRLLVLPRSKAGTVPCTRAVKALARKQLSPGTCTAAGAGLRHEQAIKRISLTCRSPCDTPAATSAPQHAPKRFPCGQRHRQPTLSSLLPVYANSEPDWISGAFSAGALHNIQDLPAELRERAVIEARQAKQEAAHLLSYGACSRLHSAPVVLCACSSLTSGCSCSASIMQPRPCHT